MKAPSSRAVIYASDVQRMTGKSEGYGRKLLRIIRKKLNKENHQFITVEEFAAYTGIKEETIREYL